MRENLGSKVIDDDKEFEKIFRSNYKRLTLYANRFVNDIQVSEEIASDSLAYLWEKRQILTFSSSVSAYLFKMVQNRAMNHLKHQRVESDYVNYLIRTGRLDEIPEYLTNPCEEKELATQIRLAVDKLPDRCREIFMLSRFGFLKNREIAERLHISENTVERQITIALDKLRKNLEYILGCFAVWFLT